MTHSSNPSAGADAQSSIPAWRDFAPAWSAEEMAGLWTSAIGIWADYFHRLAVSRTPLAALEAGAHLINDSLEISGRAVGDRLRGGGVRSPLLNDG